MKKIRIKSFCFAFITMLSFSLSCLCDMQPKVETYGMSTVAYYLYEAYLVLLTELGIVVNDGAYAYSGDKVARDKKGLTNAVDKSFKFWLASVQCNYYFVKNGCEDLWDKRDNIYADFKEQINKATTGAYTLSQDVARALNCWAQAVRSKLGYEDLDIATQYAAASDDDWEILNKGGKLSKSTIAMICAIPGYMYEDFDNLNFGRYLDNDSVEISVYDSNNVTEGYQSYFFVEHTMTTYINGALKRIPCDIELNTLTDTSYYTALVRHAKEPYSNIYATCSSETLSLYLKGYFNVEDSFKCDFSSNTYLAKDAVPRLLWNSKTGVRSQDGYISAKAIPDTALGDVYTKAGDIPKILSRPHDLTKLRDAISRVLERVKAGELTWAQAMELIKAITQAREGEQEGTAEVVEPTERVDDTENPDRPSSSESTEDTEVRNPNMTFDLKKLFPFCIPFDIYALLTLLKADPVAPKFSIPIKLGTWVNYTLVIDFTTLGVLSTVLRVGIAVFWICGLMVVTSKLIKW